MMGISGISEWNTDAMMGTLAKRRTSWSEDNPNAPRIDRLQRASTTNSRKKKKRLDYNFKELSKQIMSAKTAAGVRPAAAKCRKKLGELYKKLKSGEYDERAVQSAYLHASKMLMIAKKRIKHLEQEEEAQPALSDEPAASEQDLSEPSADMFDDLAELTQELEEDTFGNLMEELSAVPAHLESDDIEELKRKHRNEELREITKADMKYLKELFDRLEQEKREAAGGSFSSRSGAIDMSFFAGVANSFAEAGTAVCLDVQV